MNGIPYFRPIMVLFSDGLPTGSRSDTDRANQRLVEMENDGRLTIFKVGVNAQAVQALLSALPNPNSRFQPQQLDNLRFSDFFVWLSRSVSAISRSTPGGHGEPAARRLGHHQCLDRRDRTRSPGALPSASAAPA